MKFDLGKDEATELTEARCSASARCTSPRCASRLNSAAKRSASSTSRDSRTSRPRPILSKACSTIASARRFTTKTTGKELFKGEALPHFNEVDECAGLTVVVTYKLWRQLGYPPENTLHDIRWARQYKDKNLDAYVWVFLISGAAPAEHFGGYKNASSQRQPPMYFRLGGGSLNGVSKPGWIVWSRVLCRRLQAQVRHRPGGSQSKLPHGGNGRAASETDHAAMADHARGAEGRLTRDQMMAQHKSNHIQVVYAPDKAGAKKGLLVKASAMAELGLEVFVCGTV